MTYDVIQVGTGGQGERWCKQYLPPNVEDGLIDVVAAVDTNEAALENAKDGLGLSGEQCYTDAATAFAVHDADCCTVVVPPQYHEDVVDEALAHDLHILSEKPIADTLDASVRIAEKVDRADKKMGVTMSHRFDRDKTTLRRELRSGEYGSLDYLMLRFTCNCRSYGSWGAFRHDIEDPLLIEGGVHHLDILADLADARCETLYAQTWLPEWGEYGGDAQALINLTFEDGTRAVYEGAKTNAAALNGWGNEYVRAECRDATLELDGRQLERYPYDPDAEPQLGEGVDETDAERVPLLEGEKWANTLLVERFVEWLDGGEPMATNVRENLQSMALVEAAIRSSETGEPVAVQELLTDAVESVSV
ncbi:Gfo/Idh/MocA family protein [Halopiger xanaduensis]|uniref:Oxidoreductase domain protein n=1 Tax=Halopiger xanaduensis (strain DSM 18323 / JCM 14033 / SH-6) TaxID=797210 RepID=F8DCD7_HALXS|nr:Gfo/Idh/MocA family oxidoreductase [Halopiger xanaduensis]AEH38397.1 oxidoreductase domain protein [Halopiger xanaduensis SH-6]